MTLNDLEALKNFLGRQGVLTGNNDDLMEDAIFCIKNDNEYKAAYSLRGLASNLCNDGHSDLAEHVERLL